MRSEIVKRNPGTSMPLRIVLDVECNVPDEQIRANVRQNAREQSNWVKAKPAHDRVAVVCGSGPSLKDTLDELGDGADIFALNGACSFLAENGIPVDYQIILDARPETAELIGPAKQYLFASQCDPVLFKQVGALLWHATLGDEVIDFPEWREDEVIVGGGASVGNTALPLLYAMGYREIHCYGFDSSHKDGQGHAFRQALNDGEPLTLVNFRGKEYTTSLTMRLQADHFIWRARELERCGCRIFVHGSGLVPDMWNAPKLSEREKYELMWRQPDYRAVSPGMECIDRFLEVAQPSKDDYLVDFGCGTGRVSADLSGRGYWVRMVDFDYSCLDEQVKKKISPWLTFYPADITTLPYTRMGDIGICTDVMEHIPPEQVDGTLRGIMAWVPHCFFQISTVQDSCGALIGEPLHLSVHTREWWCEKFNALGFTVKWFEDGDASFCVYISTP